jgi:hypothetical protein
VRIQPARRRWLACICCGKMVQHYGGKQTAHHKCPHGVVCYAGTVRARAGGFQGPPIGGRNYCEQCVAAWCEVVRRQREVINERSL